MIRKIFIICFVFIASCSGNGNTPKGILSEDDMTNVLLDIYVTEAKIAGYTPHLVRDSAVIVFHALKEDILDEHNISDSTLRESLKYYFERPDQLDKIYARVIDSLNLKEQKQQEVDRLPQ